MLLAAVSGCPVSSLNPCLTHSKANWMLWHTTCRFACWGRWNDALYTDLFRRVGTWGGVVNLAVFFFLSFGFGGSPLLLALYFSYRIRRWDTYWWERIYYYSMLLEDFSCFLYSRFSLCSAFRLSSCSAFICSHCRFSLISSRSLQPPLGTHPTLLGYPNPSYWHITLIN